MTIMMFVVSALTCLAMDFLGGKFPIEPLPQAPRVVQATPSARKRRPMGRGESRSNFTRNAVRHHRKNFPSNPMRGGIRL